MERFEWLARTPDRFQGQDNTNAQRIGGKLMDRPEWMPVNPCDGCKKDTYAQSFRFTFEGQCICLGFAEYTGKVAAQKKLLEYLIVGLERGLPCGDGKYKAPNIIPILESMLKQLD